MTARVRVALANPGLRLKPGMSATLHIAGRGSETGAPVLTVPRGAVRADLFWGAGAAAAEAAGRMKEPGALWLLWPKGAPLPAR